MVTDNVGVRRLGYEASGNRQHWGEKAWDTRLVVTDNVRVRRPGIRG